MTKTTHQTDCRCSTGHRIQDADRARLRRASKAAGSEVRRRRCQPRNQGRSAHGPERLRADNKRIGRAGQEAADWSALRQRQGFRGQHPAEPVQPNHCGTRAGTWRCRQHPARDAPAVASGLPKSWDDIAPGHLVIAQESLEHGWWEAIVIARNGDMLTLRFREYPKLPKFVRHRAAVALVSTEV